MLKLYYASGACSFAVHAMLIECVAEFEAQKVDLGSGENKSPEFLRINPRGQIPVLIDNGVTLREGAAILTHIAEKYSSPLLPKTGVAHTRALEWMMFCNATLHPAYSRVFFMRKQTVNEPDKSRLMEVTCSIVQSLWDDVESELNKSRYIAGDDITIGDFMLCVMANWTIPIMPHFGERTKRMIAEVTGRPSYQKALANEGVTYKAVAA